MIGELVLLPSEGTFEYRGIVSANSIKSTGGVFGCDYFLGTRRITIYVVDVRFEHF